MTIAEFDQEFPCGYKLKIKIKSLMMNTDFSDITLGICPLHNKNCKKKQKETKHR